MKVIRKTKDSFDVCIGQNLYIYIYIILYLRKSHFLLHEADSLPFSGVFQDRLEFTVKSIGGL